MILNYIYYLCALDVVASGIDDIIVQTEGKLDTDMPVCFIRENKEKILVIIVRYLKRTGRGSTPSLRAIQT
jgi:hypothetical protein